MYSTPGCVRCNLMPVKLVTDKSVQDPATPSLLPRGWVSFSVSHENSILVHAQRGVMTIETQRNFFCNLTCLGEGIIRYQKGS